MAFVSFLQNHDQVGNRAFGDRLTSLAPVSAVRAAASVYLLLPQIPMIFMGEEFGADQPFPYFCDFEPELAAAVRNGRREEFAKFPEFQNPQSANKFRIQLHRIRFCQQSSIGEQRLRASIANGSHFIETSCRSAASISFHTFLVFAAAQDTTRFLEKGLLVLAGAQKTPPTFTFLPTWALHKSNSPKRRLARAYGYTGIAIRKSWEHGASSGRLNRTHAACTMPTSHPSGYWSPAISPGPATSRRSFALSRLGLPWFGGLLRSFPIGRLPWIVLRLLFAHI